MCDVYCHRLQVGKLILVGGLLLAVLWRTTSSSIVDYQQQYGALLAVVWWTTTQQQYGGLLALVIYNLHARPYVTSWARYHLVRWATKWNYYHLDTHPATPPPTTQPPYHPPTLNIFFIHAQRCTLRIGLHERGVRGGWNSLTIFIHKR